MKKIVPHIFIALFFVSACNIINPKEQTPTYLHLEPFTFYNPDSNITGSSTFSAPVAYVYANDLPVGLFDLPCTAPILINKNAAIRIIPGVYNQGLKSYVFQYPFYRSDTTTLAFAPGKTQNYTPQTRYSTDLTSTSFRFKVNFEEGLQFDFLSGDTAITIENDPTKVLSGKHSGAIYLRTPQKYSENISINYFELPTTQCYLEIDYKSSLPFQIGLQGEDNSGNVLKEYLAGFYPKNEWGKIYLELGTFTTTNSRFSKFYITIRSSLEDFEGKYTDGYVLIDNIKVISR